MAPFAGKCSAAWRRCRSLLLAVLAVTVALTAASPASAQIIGPGRPVAQAGVGTWPGVGAQASLMRVRPYLITESALYVSATPSALGGNDALIVSGGAGGEARVLGLLRRFGLAPPGPYRAGVGLRFGPSLRFQLDRETVASKNTRFRLFLEPFVRGTYQLEGGRVLFAELGALRPGLRFGLWWTL